MKKTIAVIVCTLGLIAAPALAGQHGSPKGGAASNGGGTASVVHSGNSMNMNGNSNVAGANAQNFNLGISSSKSTSKPAGGNGGCWGMFC